MSLIISLPQLIQNALKELFSIDRFKLKHFKWKFWIKTIIMDTNADYHIWKLFQIIIIIGLHN